VVSDLIGLSIDNASEHHSVINVMVGMTDMLMDVSQNVDK
jgi:hypothetical protein